MRRFTVFEMALLRHALAGGKFANGHQRGRVGHGGSRDGRQAGRSRCQSLLSHGCRGGFCQCGGWRLSTMSTRREKWSDWKNPGPQRAARVRGGGEGPPCAGFRLRS